MTTELAEERTDEAAFLAWLTSHGAVLSPSIAFHSFPRSEGGRGLIALTPIPPDTLLFSLPRPLLLTVSTSSLPALIPAPDWAALTAWTPLILCILYEAHLGPRSLWKPYFDVLPAPDSFDTLMFWSPDDLAELTGSSVLSKIGKEDAETEWREVVQPLVRKFKDVFGDEDAYALERFHWAGSLILSRSFHVEDGEDDDSDDADDDDDDEEESEKVEHVAMVPLADHLNAQFGQENAKLFYEPLSLNMISTALIPAHTQIWNTYGDPPNFDLLRRYGHVDALAPEADLVEVGLDLVARVVGEGMALTEKEREERAEWLLETGVEDTFSLTFDDPLPSELLSSIAVFLLPRSSPQLTKALSKDSPPKGKLSDPLLVNWARKTLQARQEDYPTSIEDDEALDAAALPHRKALAVRVRLGEKKVLESALKKLVVVPVLEEKGKRRRDDERGARNDEGGGKRQKGPVVRDC